MYFTKARTSVFLDEPYKLPGGSCKGEVHHCLFQLLILIQYLFKAKPESIPYDTKFYLPVAGILFLWARASRSPQLEKPWFAFASGQLFSHHTSVMKAYGNQLYSALQEEIEVCQKKGLQLTAEVEACFLLALRYWTQLRSALLRHIFLEANDEIDFFKSIKPRFISEIEYYCLVYSSELFRPSDLADEELKQYWLKEVLRLKKFRAENQDFCAYYKGGHSDRDEAYFLRAHCDEWLLPESTLYKRLEGDSSSHDHLVSTLLALERYCGYAKEKVRARV